MSANHCPLCVPRLSQSNEKLGQSVNWQSVNLNTNPVPARSYESFVVVVVLFFPPPKYLQRLEVQISSKYVTLLRKNSDRMFISDEKVSVRN